MRSDHIVVQESADDMRAEVRRVVLPDRRPSRRELDRILERIEHRLAWVQSNNMPADFPAMVRALAAHARRRS